MAHAIALTKPGSFCRPVMRRCLGLLKPALGLGNTIPARTGLRSIWRLSLHLLGSLLQQPVDAYYAYHQPAWFSINMQQS